MGASCGRRALERLRPVPEERWRRQPDSCLILLIPFLGEALWLDRVLGAYRAHGENQWTMEELDLERLREQMEGTVLREEDLREWAPELGIEDTADWKNRNPSNLQSRIASLRIAPSTHQYP